MNDMATRVLFTLLLLFFASTIGLAGLGFLVAALYLALATWLVPAAAAALTGFAVLAMLMLVLVLLRRPGASRTTAAPKGAGDLGRIAAGQLERAVREHSLLVTGGAFSAGFYLGVNPRARQALGQAVLRAQRQAMAEGGEVPPGTP